MMSWLFTFEAKMTSDCEFKTDSMSNINAEEWSIKSGEFVEKYSIKEVS